jgi:fatty aldehyde decarbonylase
MPRTNNQEITMSTPAVKSGQEGSVKHQPGYLDLLSYILSNAVAGEIMAVENYSEMVPLMPTVEAKVEAVQQAREETKHILLLQHLGTELGFQVANRIIEPQWLRIREHFAKAVERNDLAACLIIQDLMTESMAIMLYKTLAREAEADSRTATVAANILKDELEHLEIGKKRIQGLLQTNPDSVHDSLVWAHHRVAPELFGLVSTHCNYLCGELGLDCGTLSLDHIKTDLETLRGRAVEQYLEMLDSVGFSPTVTNPLIASMSAYEGLDRLGVGVSGKGCCGPGEKCC